MTRRYTQLDEQKLAEALKSEALRHTPAHSEMLHARIVQRIRMAAEVSPSSSRRVRSAATTRISLASWYWLSLPVAAMIILSLCLGSFQSKSPTPSNPAPRLIARATRPTIPAVDEICEQVASKAYDRLEAQLQERHLAYLDDDARRLAHFVLDCTMPPPLQKP
ncbi:MAG: hypothetical protein ACM359_14760 [Bacillota bacterium]